MIILHRSLFYEAYVMLEKYRATINGDRIEWNDDVPKSVRDKKSIIVDVTVVTAKPKLKKPNGKKMAEALGKIAAKGGVSSIKDPMKWQREIRKDRSLPGRK